MFVRRPNSKPITCFLCKLPVPDWGRVERVTLDGERRMVHHSVEECMRLQAEAQKRDEFKPRESKEAQQRRQKPKKRKAKR